MVVTLQTFNKVKQIYLGQIRQKFPEVNSSWVSFYLGVKKFGKVALLKSTPKVFTHI